MRLACCLLLLTCSSTVPVLARAPAACLPLTVTNADGSYIIPGARGGVVYRRVDEQDLRLDFWAPSLSPRGGRRGSGSLAPPVVIVVHGGGFTAGSRVSFVGQFLEMLATAGYAWVSIDYRLGGPSRAADAVDDVEAAVAFTRCRATELGIDPERIVLLGEDAGAALTAGLASRRPAGVVGAVLIGGLYTGVPPGTERPVTRRSRPSPPALRFLVVHGTADTEAPLREAEAWCNDAGRRDTPCELVGVAGASHRAENWWPVQWGYKARVVSWLQALAPVPPSHAPPPPAIDRVTTLPAGLHKRIPYAEGREGTPEPDRPPSGAGPPVLRTLDAWLPPDRSRPAPALVLLHGGGWEAGDRVTYITPLFAPLAEAGFAWFSVDYRLTPAVRHPRQLEDVRTAIAFIRRHARQFGIDPDRVALVGESASAQMATLLAAEDRTLAGAVSFYGVYDFAPMVTDAGPRSLAARLFGRTVLDGETRMIMREYSPLHQAGRGMPPILLIHGTGERLWDQGLRMTERLAALGVPHDLVRLEGAPHGLENWEGRPEWQYYKTRLVSWLQRHVTARRAR
jgi:alpha-L-fucosidase 2